MSFFSGGKSKGFFRRLGENAMKASSPRSSMFCGVKVLGPLGLEVVLDSSSHGATGQSEKKQTMGFRCRNRLSQGDWTIPKICQDLPR